MSEASNKDSRVPISELTLGEAESFLTSLMCAPEKTKDEGTVTPGILTFK